MRKALSARGYKFLNRGWNGDVQVITFAAGEEAAISDPRGRGVARVFSNPAP